MFPQGSRAGLPPGLRAEGERAVNDFLTAASAAGREVLEAPDTLARVFIASPFVAAYACRAPAEFLAVIAPASIAATRDAAAYRARLAPLIDGIAEEEGLRRALREVRYAEMTRIAWRDLTGQAGLPAVLGELSALADGLVEAALGWLDRQQRARYGTPCDEHGDPVQLLVLAMGKLGGGELNFSSDIDLVFLFRSDGQTTGGPRALSNQEYLDRLGKRLIACLNDTTADGFVYRVDMRLRPFGESGALATSFSALEHYYEVHGRDWERYALIKGRVIHADPRAAQALESITRPFVYRRYLDFGALEAVRGMKALITAEVARHGLEQDVKLGAGGIREVEFIAQTFQLIRGGREPRLRQRGLLPVLEACAELGLIPAQEASALATAYTFLRITEHRLQQVRDEQTQALPTSVEERARLAFSMGFEDWTAFLVGLEGHRAQVRASFGALLDPGGREAPAVPAAAPLWGVPVGAGPDAARLAAGGFDEPERAAALIAELRDERFLGRLSQEARTRLDRLMPPLFAVCAAGTAATETLARVAALVRAVARRSVYLALLADNPDALRRLVDLCRASAWIARELTGSPILLDELLDSRNLYSPPPRRLLERQLDEALENSHEDGLERVMEVLRLFKHQQVLRVAASDLMAGFPIASVSNHLTWIAEVLIDRARAVAWRDLADRHGEPRLAANPQAGHIGFAIIAYGKLGGLELGYGSDLDLVFVHDAAPGQQMTDGPRPVAADVFLTRLAQRIIHLLATRTPAGTAYELDVRLRPSGAAGLLVSGMAAFAEYQRREAWTWEHQALVRARAVAGHPETRAAFERVRREILRRPRDAATLRADIVQMRERMRQEIDRSDLQIFDLKQGLGGITDIEFVVQYAVLRWAATHEILCAFTDNLRLLDLIADLGLISRADSDSLRVAYFAYRAEVHRCALQEIDGMVDASCFTEERAAVAAVWARVMQP